MRTFATAGVLWISRLDSPFDTSLHLGESSRNNSPLKPFRAALLGLCLKLGGWGVKGGMPLVSYCLRGPNAATSGLRGRIGWEAEPNYGVQEPVWFRNSPRKTLAGRGAILSIDDAVSWPWKQLEMLRAGDWEVLGSLTPVQKGLSPSARTFGLNCVQR